MYIQYIIRLERLSLPKDRIELFTRIVTLQDVIPLAMRMDLNHRGHALTSSLASTYFTTPYSDTMVLQLVKNTSGQTKTALLGAVFCRHFSADWLYQTHKAPLVALL